MDTFESRTASLVAVVGPAILGDKVEYALVDRLGASGGLVSRQLGSLSAGRRTCHSSLVHPRGQTTSRGSVSTVLVARASAPFRGLCALYIHRPR